MACARLTGADEKLSVKNELVLRIAIGFGTTAGQGGCDRIVDVGRHKMDLSRVQVVRTEFLIAREEPAI